MSLFKTQIDFTTTQPYNFDMDKLREELLSFFSGDYRLKINCKRQARKLLCESKLTGSEYLKLLRLIKSEDTESVNIASIILNDRENGMATMS